MSDTTGNRIRIDKQLVKPLQEEAEKHYHDLAGFVNYILRLYLIGDLVKPNSQVTNVTSKTSSRVDSNANATEEVTTASELPEFLADIDLA